MTHGSLFSGIGGFEIGAKESNIENVWSCEINPFSRKILAKHFPNITHYEDIRTLTEPRYVDIISGGFPCQDISINGKGEGINGQRSGLWGEMYRIIRGVRPLYAILENSPMLLNRGFERILHDFSEIGYNVEWQTISNLSFGFPHRRERLYVIAYPNLFGQECNLPKERSIKPIFKQLPSDAANGYSLSQRIHEIAAYHDIRNDYGLRDWTHRVGALGNSVNPVITHYLFECIKSHFKPSI